MLLASLASGNRRKHEANNTLLGHFFGGPDCFVCAGGGLGGGTGGARRGQGGGTAGAVLHAVGGDFPRAAEDRKDVKTLIVEMTKAAMGDPKVQEWAEAKEKEAEAQAA